MRRFLDDAVSRYDFVIVDTPPVLAVADPVVLGSLTGGVISGPWREDTADAVIRARDELRRSNVRILGVLLNALKDETASHVPRPLCGPVLPGCASHRTAEPPSSVRHVRKSGSGMRLLVTGHLGYIGTVMVRCSLRGYEVVGLDSDLFERCTFGDPPSPCRPSGRPPDIQLPTSMASTRSSISRPSRTTHWETWTRT